MLFRDNTGSRIDYISVFRSAQRTATALYIREFPCFVAVQVAMAELAQENRYRLTGNLPLPVLRYIGFTVELP